MTKQEAGRLGGLATSKKHGASHMSRIGKKGFRALCRKFPGNNRRYALMHLNGKGKVAARFIPSNTAAMDASDLYDAVETTGELPY